MSPFYERLLKKEHNKLENT